jgi:hypothetical protein
MAIPIMPRARWKVVAALAAESSDALVAFACIPKAWVTVVAPVAAGIIETRRFLKVETLIPAEIPSAARFLKASLSARSPAIPKARPEKRRAAAAVAAAMTERNILTPGGSSATASARFLIISTIALIAGRNSSPNDAPACR